MKKEVPVKNYVILAVVFLLTVGLVFYLRDWYNTTKEYYARNSVMTDVVREIKSEEIGNFTLENQKFILYVSSGQDANIKGFENDLRDLIQKVDLNDDVLYMNLDGTNSLDFYDLLKNNFSANSKIKNQITDSVASMYVFTDGKITALLNNVNNYSIKRLETIIDRWEIK